MKGLMIKDMKLIAGQKRFYIIIILIGIMSVVTGMDPAFFVGYITFLFTMLAITTLTYDEHENGMQFLLTLPVTARTYVKEKYIFSIAASALAAAIGTVFYLIVSLGMGNANGATVSEIILVCTGEFMAVLFVLALTLPLIIYFGAEKGRMVLISIIVLLTLIAALAKMIVERAGFGDQLAECMDMNGTALYVATIVFVIAGVLLSSAISVRILEKKEF